MASPQHAWRLSARDGYTSRWRCERCGCIKTSANMGDAFPRIRYRLISDQIMAKAPPCKAVA